MRFIKGTLIVVLSFIFLISTALVIVTAMGVLQGNTLGEVSASYYFILKNAGISAGCLFFLYLLQKPSQATALQASFRNKKWLLGVSGLGLFIGLFVLFQLPVVRGFTEQLIGYGTPGVAVLMAVYLGLFTQVARVIWRCPSCGHQLPSRKTTGPGLQVMYCPSCGKTLGY